MVNWRSYYMQFAYNLKADNIVYSWGKRLVLDHISLDLEPGEIIGLVGANGAGKSTFVRVISGDLRPHSGTVTVNDVPVCDLSCRAEMFGISAEAYGYPYDLSVKNLISYWKTVFHLPSDHVDNLVNIYKLTSFWTKRLRKLSTGQRKRVQLTMAFLTDAPILLLDEPFTGLDAEATILTRKLLIKAQNMGKSILLITHLFPELERLASRAYVLSDCHLSQLDNISEEGYEQLVGTRLISID